jgi:hypothetical protein
MFIMGLSNDIIAIVGCMMLGTISLYSVAVAMVIIEDVRDLITSGKSIKRWIRE